MNACVHLKCASVCIVLNCVISISDSFGYILDFYCINARMKAWNSKATFDPSNQNKFNSDTNKNEFARFHC